MYVTAQPWPRDQDYASAMKDMQPPPPPGDETVWELHFCKWWGWNWVRRNQAMEAPMQRRVEGSLQQQRPRESLIQQTRIQSPPLNAQPNQSAEHRKSDPPKPTKPPEKKPIKNLCRTLCFKNKKKQKPLQNMYNTPSNSVIEERNVEKTEAPQNTYAQRPSAMPIEDAFQKEVEDMVAKENKNVMYGEARPCEKKKQWSTSSSDECSCCYCGEKYGSSSEGSVEYINIKCCPCCHPREPPPLPKPLTCESCTQRNSPVSKMMATQTEQKEREKKRKKRRICVVCCSCGQNSMPSHCCCCYCEKGGRAEEKTEKKRDRHCCLNSVPENKCVGADERRLPKDKRHHKYSATYRVTTEQASPLRKTAQPTQTMRKNFEPFYKTGMPLDMMLYNDYNKPITKFGMPSQNYSWIHATKSDIWDQLSHLRVGHEFSSPISGNRYSISPIKVESLGTEPSVLLNPLSVEDEVQSLKKIESEVKMDLKSRIMLDAVCDAILSRDKDSNHNSSIFLNEFTYPSSVTQTDSILNDLYKSERKLTSSKVNQTPLDEIISDVKCCEKNRNVRDIGSEMNSSLSSQGNDLTKVRSPRTYAMENPYKGMFPNPSFSLNYLSPPNHFRPARDNGTTCKFTDYVIKNNQPLAEQMTFSKTGLMSAYKRSASPTRAQNIKKAKLREPPSLSPLNNRSIADIFTKIDEIVLRSKVNNDEIQNVLNTIPKRTFQFFTSWEVSNVANQSVGNENPSVANQNPPLQIKEEEKASTSSVNTENQESQAKAPHVKKKKAVARPSLIPKRVTNAKLNKK